MADNLFTQLPNWLRNPNSFPDRFLSQSCPLLEIAQQAHESGRQQELVTLLNGNEWQRFLCFCDATWRKGADAPQHLPSVVLQARRHLILAAMGGGNEQDLATAVQLTQSATGYSSVSQLKSLCHDTARFESTDVVRRLRSAGQNAVDQFRNLAATFGGWNPALLSTATAYAQIFAPAPNAVHTVQTHLLFALGEAHGGQVARLILDRIEFDSDGGGGACYPDAASMGFVKSHSDFQHALQQAWWREIFPYIADCSFDIRWSLQLVGDHGGHNINGDVDLRDLRTQLLLPLSGPSAGMAFASAFRALRLRERLDPHLAITADFAAHFDELNDEAKAVGSVPDKLRAELERAGIDEVLTSNGDPYFKEHNVQPDDDGVLVAKPQRGRLRLIGLSTLVAFYKRASQHARVARHLKAKMVRRTQAILEDLGGLYTRSPMSRDADLATEEEVQQAQQSEEAKQFLIEKGRIRVTDAEAQLIQKGRPDPERRFPNRLRFLADSGFGKSTMFVEIEHQIAGEDNVRVPIRVGAGPGKAGETDGKPNPLPLLSQVPWQHHGDTDLVHLATWFYSHLWKPLCGSEMSMEQAVPWFVRSVELGEIVFLLDSTDQSDSDLGDLDLFLQSQPQCMAFINGRPETREYKREAYQLNDWHRYWLEPFGEREVRSYCKVVGIADQLWNNEGWRSLVIVPVLLKEMVALAADNNLGHVRNRESVYALALERLVEHGRIRSRNKDRFTKHLARATSLHQTAAWATITQESKIPDRQMGTFTGRLSGADAVQFQELLEQKYDSTEPLESLGLLTMAFLEQTRGTTSLAWRHFSFCEWFAGIHLASLSADEQENCIRQHALDERWASIFRFAMSAAAREEKKTVVNHLATSFLSFGAAFLLWNCIGTDQVTIDEELDTLCRWLVHRHKDSWGDSWDFRGFCRHFSISPWSGRSNHARPAGSKALSLILKRMFGVGETEPWQRRDSRWLHPAWQLVVENLPEATKSNEHPSIVSNVISLILKRMFGAGKTKPWQRRDTRWLHPAWQPVNENLREATESNEHPSPIMQACQEIHDSFLGEFEDRIGEAVIRNQSTIRSEWRFDDRGLLQLVPDDVLLDLGVLPSHTKHGKTNELLRHWPRPKARTYEQRRDQFNAQLRELGANYCLCPPADWEHPYLNTNGAPRNPRECYVHGRSMRRQSDGIWVKQQEINSPKPHFLPEDYQLQRTPVTNLQFEVFDPSHRSCRQMHWYRPEMEQLDQTLDDHPVVKVSWYQAVMMCIWLTGHGSIGTFRLPFSEDWEACCRAGRDNDKDEFGIPWCDEQQFPILDPAGREQFDTLSSFGANFEGKYSLLNWPIAPIGPSLNGTVPVGQYPANGFGCIDQHGQVWEWCQNRVYCDERNPSEEYSAVTARCVCGGLWAMAGNLCRASQTDYSDSADSNYGSGFRLSRTP